MRLRSVHSSVFGILRQTMLNGHAARIDTDGKLRIVVSARATGVANWLDTLGKGRGFGCRE